MGNSRNRAHDDVGTQQEVTIMPVLAFVITIVLMLLFGILFG